MSSPETNGSLSAKAHATILNSIRSDASKTRQALDRMKIDAVKLAGTPSGDILNDSITVMEVGLRHLRDLFRLDI